MQKIPVADRRKHRRYKVVEAGKVVVSTGSIDVEIYDIGVGGARLEIPANITIPDMFDLLMVADGTLYPARIRWRNELWVGVSFEGAPHTLPAGA